MKTIFKEIAELRNFITIDVSSDLSVIMPYLKQAEKYVRDIIGDTLFDMLVEFVQDETTSEVLTKLLPYCQLALANFGYFLAIDKLNVNVGNAGITVASTSSLVPASKERIDRLRESVELSGYDALEELIKFLEKNISDYPEWKDSEAYSYNKQFFINNADDFYKTIHKQITRLQFLSMKEFIALAEIKIKGVVCSELFEELKAQILSEEISNANKILLEDIKPAICYLSIDFQSENPLARNEANCRMETLRLFLNANAEDYPLYLNSTCYSSTLKSDLNDEESGLFTFGI